MTQAYIIETPRFTAGIVAAQRHGFRFFASHPEAAPLEGRIFGSPGQAQRAAEALARGEAPAREEAILAGPPID